MLVNVPLQITHQDHTHAPDTILPPSLSQPYLPNPILQSGQNHAVDGTLAGVNPTHS